MFKHQKKFDKKFLFGKKQFFTREDSKRDVVNIYCNSLTLYDELILAL